MQYDLYVGFSRIDITPPMGVNLRGYFHQRICEGVIDHLEINAIALKKNDAIVVLITIDSESCDTDYFDKARDLIAKTTGIDKKSIFINCTHTHVACCHGLEDKWTNEVDREHDSYVLKKLVDASLYAIADLKPAKMGFAISKAERIGFNRRYLMKDGSTKTNPGVNNPDIVKSIGLLDESLNVIRFERECGDNIVVANYGNHPDVVGGNLVSADWPGFTRRILEKAIDNTKCIFFNGAQGDINHVNVKPVGGDLNGMFNDFDDVTRGYAHSRHMGNVVAGAIMSVYEKVEFVPCDEIKFIENVVQVPSNMPKPEDMEQARYIDNMHKAGRDSELPYKGMMLTTVVAEAERMVSLENGPEMFPMNLLGIKIGCVAFVGIPGEPFTGIGIGLKSAEGWKMICPTCLTNGNRGYFPMKDSYDEGGYEARSSIYKSGVAEKIIEEGIKLLNDLKN